MLLGKPLLGLAARNMATWIGMSEFTFAAAISLESRADRALFRSVAVLRQ
jgi:hypothetical protein